MKFVAFSSLDFLLANVVFLCFGYVAAFGMHSFVLVTIQEVSTHAPPTGPPRAPRKSVTPIGIRLGT